MKIKGQKMMIKIFSTIGREAVRKKVKNQTESDLGKMADQSKKKIWLLMKSQRKASKSLYSKNRDLDLNQ